MCFCFFLDFSSLPPPQIKPSSPQLLHVILLLIHTLSILNQLYFNFTKAFSPCFYITSLFSSYTICLQIKTRRQCVLALILLCSSNRSIGFYTKYKFIYCIIFDQRMMHRAKIRHVKPFQWLHIQLYQLSLPLSLEPCAFPFDTALRVIL